MTVNHEDKQFETIEIKGQTDPTYSHEYDNGTPYDPDNCWADCIQYNYFYGQDATAPGGQIEFCVLYDVYVSASTWLLW